MGLDSVGTTTDEDLFNSSLPDSSEDLDNDPNIFFIPDPEDMNPASNPLFAHIIIFYTLTFIIGLVSNIIAMAVMIGDRKNRSTTSMFLTSLTAADLLLVVVCIPIELIHYFMAFHNIGYTCKLAKYTELLSPVASVLNLCAVSFERVIVIVFPMRSRSICTMRNCRRTIFLVWVLASMLSVPAVWVVEGYSVIYTNNVTSVSVYYCQETESSWPFAVYQVITIFALPGLFLSVCYTYVIRELWKSTRTITMLTNASSFKSRNVRRSAKTKTRLSTLEEESMYTSTTTQGQSQKRMDSILCVNASYSANSPRTETVTLSELDSVINTGLSQEIKTPIELQNTLEGEMSKGGGDSKSSENDEMDRCIGENGAEGELDDELGHCVKLEDINGNAMKEDNALETDKNEDLESFGKKSENGIENTLERDETDNFQITIDANQIKSSNDIFEKPEQIGNENAQNELKGKTALDINTLRHWEGHALEDGHPIRRKSRSSIRNPLIAEHAMEAIDEIESELSDEHQKSPKSDHNGTNTLDTLRRTRSRLQSLFRKKSHLTNQQLKAEEAKNARKQVILMLILVIILFMICWGPRVVFTVILKACGSGESCLILYTPFWYKVKIFFSLIPYVHCSINPFIYSFMSKNFKRSMRRQLNRLGTYFGVNWFGCKGISNDTKRLMQLRSQDINRTVTGHINESTTNIV